MAALDCKAAWKSLGDSKRYHTNKAKKAGSSCDLELEVDENIPPDAWDYSEDISFMCETSTQRETFSTFLDESCTEQPEPTYSYLQSTPACSNRRQTVNELQTTAEKVVQQMATVIEMRKNEVAQPKHHHLLSHLGSIIEQLPDPTVNALGAKFIAMTYDELKKINKN